MKYWREGEADQSRLIGISLIDGDYGRVLSLSLDKDGEIIFTEECDGYYNVVLSKEDAKAALQEAIDWIDKA